jgi:hypothetical protein
VQAELVERGHLPADLSLKISHARDMTVLPDPGEDVPPLSTQTGQTLLEIVRELSGLAREQVVKAGL